MCAADALRRLRLMVNAARSIQIEPRLAFRVYAVAAIAGGAALAAWGPLWFGAHLPGQPWGIAVLVRLVGAIVAAAGCAAAGMAAMETAATQRRALQWFVAAHVVVLVMLFAQRSIVWPSLPQADLAVSTLFAVSLGFLYVLAAATVPVEPPASPLGLDRPSSEALRSDYEHGLREAASREERHRLARDLHDSIKQQIFAMQTAAATAQARFDKDPDGARAALESVRASAREAMTEMEAMLDQLRASPLEPVGLVEGLKKQTEAIAFRTGAVVDVTIGEIPAAATLPPGTAQAMFRVAQEGLANVARHARASDVRVGLGAESGEFVLTIADNGRGLAPDATTRGMGLTNMRARAREIGGSLVVQRRDEGGTMLRMSVPYTTAADLAAARRQLLITMAVWLVLLAFSVYRVVDGRASSALAWLVVATVGTLHNFVSYRRLHRRPAA